MRKLAILLICVTCAISGMTIAVVLSNNEPDYERPQPNPPSLLPRGNQSAETPPEENKRAASPACQPVQKQGLQLKEAAPAKPKADGPEVLPPRPGGWPRGIIG